MEVRLAPNSEQLRYAPIMFTVTKCLRSAPRKHQEKRTLEDHTQIARPN